MLLRLLLIPWPLMAAFPEFTNALLLMFDPPRLPNRTSVSFEPAILSYPCLLPNCLEGYYTPLLNEEAAAG